MTNLGERYRKLPGHRRGILRGASVWMGADHLLSIKSLRFREEYKRFHLRDVQAIVVVRTPRFHLSTRALLLGWLWLTVTAAVSGQSPALIAMAVIAIGLVGAWAYVSAAASCRCRIYTAVSREELPSIYRTWTARKFLAVVEPRIREVQGAMEANWVEALEARTAGPVPPPPPPMVAEPVAESSTFAGGVPPPPRPIPAPAGSAARTRNVVTDILLATLFADAALNWVARSSSSKTLEMLWYALALLQVACAALIFVQRHRGILKSGMQKLAIANLVALGASFYFRQVLEGVARTSPTVDLSAMPGYQAVRLVDAGLSVVLGMVGVFLILKDRISED